MVQKGGVANRRTSGIWNISIDILGALPRIISPSFHSTVRNSTYRGIVMKRKGGCVCTDELHGMDRHQGGRMIELGWWMDRFFRIRRISNSTTSAQHIHPFLLHLLITDVSDTAVTHRLYDINRRVNLGMDGWMDIDRTTNVTSTVRFRIHHAYTSFMNKWSQLVTDFSSFSSRQYG
jgi:hypothetical protein